MDSMSKSRSADQARPDIQPMSDLETDQTSPRQRSSAASRMQQMRARRREGEAIVALKVEPNVIAALSALGWLRENDHRVKGAIARALTDFVERAIWAQVSPSTGSQGQICFVSELQTNVIDTLIALRWLPVDCGGDLDAIVKAFHLFVDRALEVARRGGGGLDLWNIPRNVHRSHVGVTRYA
jgi:hypothetical protein